MIYHFEYCYNVKKSLELIDVLLTKTVWNLITNFHNIKQRHIKNFLETEAPTDSEILSHFQVSVEKPAATLR